MDAAQQYSLSWNHFHSNLSSGFQALLKEQALVDVTLAVDGRYLQAHKLVLSICSPYFRQLFQVNPCQHPIVVLQDAPYKIFKSLLHFMYRGEVKVSQNDLAAFMKVAEVLKVKGLTENEPTPSSNEVQPKTENKPETSKTNTQMQQPQQSTSTNGFTSPFISNEEQMILAQKPRSIRPKILRAPPPIQMAIPKLQTSTSSSSAKRTKIEPSPSSSIVNEEMKQLQMEAARWEREKQMQREREPAEIPSVMMQCKEEPVEAETETECYQDETAQYNNDLDIGSLMSSTMEEGPEGSEAQFQTDLMDTSTPGRVTVLKSRKGLPVLIHNGHIYTKQGTSETDKRSKWLCVKQRILKCGGCLTVGNGNELTVLSYSGHNHTQLHDIIKRLQAYGSNGSNSSGSGSPSHDFPTDLSLPHCYHSFY